MFGERLNSIANRITSPEALSFRRAETAEKPVRFGGLSSDEFIRLGSGSVATETPLSEDISQYNDKPLPFRAVPGIPAEIANITWKDFKTNAAGTASDLNSPFVYVFRGLDAVAKDDDNLSICNSARSHDKTPTKAEYFKEIGSPDEATLMNMAHEASAGITPGQHFLHVSLDRNVPDSFAGAHGTTGYGVTVPYRIPKAWLLQPENQPLIAHKGERELDFFWGLPEAFIDRENIQQYGTVPAMIERTVRTLSPVETAPSTLDDSEIKIVP
jgi:hypothetical protein